MIEKELYFETKMFEHLSPWIFCKEIKQQTTICISHIQSWTIIIRVISEVKFHSVPQRRSYLLFLSSISVIYLYWDGSALKLLNPLNIFFSNVIPPSEVFLLFALYRSLPNMHSPSLVFPDLYTNFSFDRYFVIQ